MPAALVGQLALGLGLELLFVGTQAHIGHADNGISLDLERAAHVDRHLELAQRFRFDRALDLALEQ